MSVSKYRYTPSCDGQPCPGDCDLCGKEDDMDDLISRQAAIDVTDSETVSTNPEHFKSSEKFIKFMDDDDIASFGKWEWANGFNTALVATKVQLEKLPSAQPDLSGYSDKLWKLGFESGRKFERAERGWIPVSERLPEEPYGCLVTVWDTNPVTMDEFENILPYFVWWDGEQWNDGEGEQCPFEVIAWMPLQEPYAERRTDE